MEVTAKEASMREIKFIILDKARLESGFEVTHIFCIPYILDYGLEVDLQDGLTEHCESRVRSFRAKERVTIILARRNGEGVVGLYICTKSTPAP